MKHVILADVLNLGNTDTASYWNLSKSIFRYVGGPIEEYESNEHSERGLRLETYIAGKLIRCIQLLMRRSASMVI